MKNLKFLLFLIIPMLFFHACDRKNAQSGGHDILFEIDETFKLGMDKTAKLKHDDLVLHFKEVVSDSRCPEGVNCVWEGEVKIILAATTGNTNYELEMKRKGGQLENEISRTGTYDIYLLSVDPYPKEGETIKAEDYKLTLVVKRI